MSGQGSRAGAPTATYNLTRLVAKLRRLEGDGEPLACLVAELAIQDPNDTLLVKAAITTLSYIARNDRAACKLIGSALTNGAIPVRDSAISALTRIKHG